MSDKVREWFLYKSVSDDPDTLTAVPRGNDELDQYANMITVIEKSAYDRLAEINKVLVEALEWLVIDVQDYETWERPCAAVTNAQAALAKAKEMGK